jgi:hypothetical protein
LIAARPILSELDLFRADPARFGHATPFRVTHVPFNLILLNLAINARDASRPAGCLAQLSEALGSLLMTDQTVVRLNFRSKPS